MTSTQIQYWNYREGNRHNIATELQARNELAETVTHNRATESAGFTQAKASLMQAKAAKSQAKTAKGNLKVNRKNANTNRMNVAINAQNAATNARNAATNAWNAQTNARNADTNARNAATNAKNAATNRMKAKADIKQINTNIDKMSKEIDKLNLEVVNYDRDKVLLAKDGAAGSILKFTEYFTDVTDQALQAKSKETGIPIATLRATKKAVTEVGASSALSNKQKDSKYKEIWSKWKWIFQPDK